MFAENSTQLAAPRFITGIRIGEFIPIDTAMISEYMPARRRGQMMAWFAVFFPVGGLLAPTMGLLKTSYPGSAGSIFRA